MAAAHVRSGRHMRGDDSGPTGSMLRPWQRTTQLAVNARSVALALATVMAAVTLALTASAAASAPASRPRTPHSTSGLAKRPLAARSTRPVIVLLRAQFHAALTGSHEAIVRADQIKAEQQPLLDQLRASHALDIRVYSLVNSFAATVSAAERARLAANPAVARVIPDSTISLTVPSSTSSPGFRTDTSSDSGASPPLNTIPNACSSNENQPQLDPEGLALTGVDSTSTSDQTARSLGITGAGVKVAWIADGLDINNENFIRPDGNSVFSSTVGGDYQDFSGDGPGRATGGGEAFIDANTIAGQGLVPYNVQDFGAQPDPTACWIRIEGVAPGASLVGLDVFGNSEDTTTSDFLEAINYAVQNDHVNVLNESFGGNDFPDVTSLDAIKQFNDAAVDAGTFVAVSTGDAGPFNTIGTPATDPAVMSAGASTDFRFYAQTNYAAARYFADGWDDNQIGALSSGGFDETGGTVDIVAPGDMSFASCDASAQFSDCTNFLGQPSDVERSGGTSESAPFVAGAAALVIQAYRQTHDGATPSPAVIGHILTSTATDLAAPAQEQGSGLLNAFKAVELAESIPGSGVSPNPVGSTLLSSAEQLSEVGTPGQTDQFRVTVTNTGSTPQTVGASTRTYGSQYDVETGHVTLADGTSPTFQSFAGVTNNYEKFSFTVPAGASRLVGAISWPVDPDLCLQTACNGGLNSRVRLILIDPAGNLAADSIPQGSGSFGTVEVNTPEAGTWQGVIFGIDAADGGTNGRVPWEIGFENPVSFGTVSPSSFALSPGQSESIELTVAQPTTPGDSAGSILLDAEQAGTTTSIPVTLRSLINVSAGGSFYGVLTGGNGRPNGEGQEQYYQFSVPAGAGITAITANLRFLNDPDNPVAEYLVAPGGDTLGYGENSVISGTGTATPGTSLSAYALDPVAGLWTLIVVFAEPTAGNEIWEPYFGRVVFNAVRVSATGVPDGGGLVAGKATTVPVTITNTGAATEDYFIDPRLDETENVTLSGSATGPLQLPLTGSFPTWVVPPETSSVQVVSSSGLPAMFDFGPIAGDPDIADAELGSTLCSTAGTGSFSSPAGETVTAGIWYAAPTECGPYLGPAPSTTDSIAMTAETKAFDTSVGSTTGDGWLGSVGLGSTFTPLVLAPWQTGVVDVTFTPVGSPKTVVSGTLYVDTLQSSVPPPADGQQSGDELAAIPYTYTITAAASSH